MSERIGMARNGTERIGRQGTAKAKIKPKQDLNTSISLRLAHPYP
jgi:hypothetical protein